MTKKSMTELQLEFMIVVNDFIRCAVAADLKLSNLVPAPLQTQSTCLSSDLKERLSEIRKERLGSEAADV